MTVTSANYDGVPAPVAAACATSDARHREGFNCAQSVLAAFAAELGLPFDEAMRLAAPFGGGIGRQGEICGAATGALMALGLGRGSAAPGNPAKDHMYAIAAEFVRRFQERTGALRCRDLLQADISTPAGHAEARARNAFAICPRAIAAATEIAHDLLHPA